MPTNIVENIFEDFSVLIKYLEENNEISLKNEADNNFKKEPLEAHLFNLFY